MKIGFVGQGAMGKPMARNLIKAGYEVYVYDVVDAAVKEMEEHGATGCVSPKLLARQVDVVIYSLPNEKIVEEVLTGEEGVLAGSHSGEIIVDMSSVSPQFTKQMAQIAAKEGVFYVDAPVSGGVSGAEKGTLTILAGGDAEIIERLMPVFTVLGDKITHVGELGSGDAVKLVNNLILGCSMAAVAEALVLGAKVGLDPQTMYDIIKRSSGRCYALEAKGEKFILPGNFDPGFAIDLQCKDLDLALDTAKKTGVPIPMGALARQVFEMARAKGLNKEDISAVIKIWEDLTGVKVRA